MNKETAKIIPFRKRKPRLSDKVQRILDSQPILKARLERFLSNIPDEDKIPAIETIVRREYFGE